MHTLTPIDLAALRKADSIVFRHLPDRGSAIEANKRAKQTEADPFSQDIVHIIPTCCAAVDYDQPEPLGTHMKPDVFKGFEMEHIARDWGIAYALKAGDVLTLEWARDGGRTPALESRAPTWHVDLLYLTVKRGDRSLRFLIERAICQDNTARMIRRIA